MQPMIFFVPGKYENPLTESGRGRTIAALHLAQGDVAVLTNAEMRRDVLSALMSPRAVAYWLNEKGWLEKSRKVGNVQLLRLTDAGLTTCANCLAGGSEVPTTFEIVAGKRKQMMLGGAGTKVRTFAVLPANP
jgi:hypothetical protein